MVLDVPKPLESFFARVHAQRLFGFSSAQQGLPVAQYFINSLVISLTSTFVPTGDRNNLAAFVAVNADPGEDYGQFRVLELPRSLQINGPSQVQNALESDDQIAEITQILTYEKANKKRKGVTAAAQGFDPVGGLLLLAAGLVAAIVLAPIAAAAAIRIALA